MAKYMAYRSAWHPAIFRVGFECIVFGGTRLTTADVDYSLGKMSQEATDQTDTFQKSSNHSTTCIHVDPSSGVLA